MAQKHSIEIPGAVGRSFVLLRPSAVFLLTAGVFVKPSSRHAAQGPWAAAFGFSVPTTVSGRLNGPTGGTERARRTVLGVAHPPGGLGPPLFGTPGPFFLSRVP